MVAYAVNYDMGVFKNTFGQFSIIHSTLIGLAKASGMTPTGSNTIYLNDDFGFTDAIHSNRNPDEYKSQSFVDMFGNGCIVGELGCVSNDNNNYCVINQITGGGCGDWNPNPDLNNKQTTGYGAYSSVDDFADSFASYVLMRNGRNVGGYIVTNLRTTIIELWVNKITQ